MRIHDKLAQLGLDEVRSMRRVGAFEPRIDRNTVEAALARIRARAQALAAGRVPWETLKADRDFGRP